MKIDIKDIKKVNLTEDDLLIIKVNEEHSIEQLDLLRKVIENRNLKGKQLIVTGNIVTFEAINIKENKGMLKKLIKECLKEMNL